MAARKIKTLSESYALAMEDKEDIALTVSMVMQNEVIWGQAKKFFASPLCNQTIFLFGMLAALYRAGQISVTPVPRKAKKGSV